MNKNHENDLIRRGDVLKIIHKHYCDCARIEEAVLCLPTAHDIDEIVKQLEDEKEYQKKNAIDKNFQIGVVNGLNAAIRIVKGGTK